VLAAIIGSVMRKHVSCFANLFHRLSRCLPWRQTVDRPFEDFVGRAHHRTIHQVTMQEAMAEALVDYCKKNDAQITLGDAS
jgi:hypothetical protein